MMTDVANSYCFVSFYLEKNDNCNVFHLLWKEVLYYLYKRSFVMLRL